MWRPGATTRILVGMGIGLLLGLGLRRWTSQPWSDRELMYLQFPGELFLRSVNCLILPLVISSVVSASSAVSGADSAGSVGKKALVYYATTTSLGIGLCVFLAETVRPGDWGRRDRSGQEEPPGTPVRFVTTDTFLDLARNLLPENLVQATLSQYQTVLVDEDGAADEASGQQRQHQYRREKGGSEMGKPENRRSVYDLEVSHAYSPGTNVLGLVFVGLVFGLALARLDRRRSEPLRKFFGCLADTTSRIVDSLVELAPVAVVFLVSGKILRSGTESSLTFVRLGVFVLTVFTGLLVQALLVLPGLYLAATRKSPLRIMGSIGPALTTAFGTSSSTATVPTTIRCLDKLGIDARVSRFVAPIGATINMDGIALYETVGALFIMQMRGFDLSLVQTVAISITCTLSCVGAAGIPSGGYAMLIMVLNSLGIPADDVALIIAVDSFVDRFRTMVNIVADCLGSGIISDMIQNEKHILINRDKTYEVVPANEESKII